MQRYNKYFIFASEELDFLYKVFLKKNTRVLAYIKKKYYLCTLI